jgi:hypothetical protein
MKGRLTLFAAMAYTVLVYLPGLGGPLVLDDHANLEPLVRWLHGAIGWKSVIFDNGSSAVGRPLAMATFLANAATTGESVYAFKATALAIHLAMGFCVYALFAALARRQLATAPAALVRWAPIAVAAAWLLHPLLVSTVLYVVQRMAMLAALFIMLALLSYVHGRVALESGRRRKAAILLCIAVPACTFLAIISKENGILAPALCGLVEWLAFAPRAGSRRTRASSLFVFASLLAPALAAVALTLGGEHHIVGGYANRPFTLAERLLTQSRVLWHYVGALLLPRGPALGLYHDDFQLSRGLLSPSTTLLSLLAWASVLVGAWRCRRSVPAFSLGMGIFFVGQALESSVFPLLMYFEHRMYLPSLGLLWATVGLVGWAAPTLAHRMHHGGRILGATAIALVLVLGLATAARASVWRSQEAILSQALAYHPQSRWMRMDYIAFDMGKSPPDVAGAMAHAEYLLERPDAMDRRFGALMALSIRCVQGQEVSRKMIDGVFGGPLTTIEPDLLVGLESLSARTMQSPCAGFGPAEMEASLAAALDRSTLPKHHRSIWRLRFQAARLALAANRPEEALEQARLAWAGGAGGAPVALLTCALLLQKGDNAGAAAMLRKAEPLVAKQDRAGQELLRSYRAELSRRRSSWDSRR